MTENIAIRAFEQRDLTKLHEIRKAAFKPVFQSFRSIVGEDIATVALSNLEREQATHLDKVCDKTAAHDVFVAERSSEIIGFCAISYDRQLKLGEIDLNAVRPDCQSEGVGALMYERALRLMREAGMRAATVGTGGDDSHAPARRAYQKAGFGPGIPSVYLYRLL